MRENRLSGLMRGGKQAVVGFASQSVASRLLYTARQGEKQALEDWPEASASSFRERFTT
jgi:hypothetical protein